MTPLALALLLATSAAPDGASPCREIRAVERLATDEGLDRATLVTLRSRYCKDVDDEARRAPPPDSSHPRKLSPECRDLSMMGRLARTSTTDQAMIEAIETLQAATCAPGAKPISFTWPNGTTARVSDGTWRYPSGATAKLSDGTWRYVSGSTARLSDGSWRYPSGSTAKFPDGTWRTPDGRTIEESQLLVDAAVPAREAERLRGLTGDDYAAQLMELVWSARR